MQHAGLGQLGSARRTDRRTACSGSRSRPRRRSARSNSAVCASEQSSSSAEDHRELGSGRRKPAFSAASRRARASSRRGAARCRSRSTPTCAMHDERARERAAGSCGGARRRLLRSSVMKRPSAACSRRRAGRPGARRRRSRPADGAARRRRARRCRPSRSTTPMWMFGRPVGTSRAPGRTSGSSARQRLLVRRRAELSITNRMSMSALDRDVLRLDRRCSGARVATVRSGQPASAMVHDEHWIERTRTSSDRASIPTLSRRAAGVASPE